MSIALRSKNINSNLSIQSFIPRHSVTMEFPENSPYTKQEFKNECDINIILAQYQHTGEIPNLNERQGQFMDCTGLDYMEHMNKIVEANSLFSELPSAIRERFQNSPAAFLDFVHDEKNTDEMRKLGLLRPVNPVVPVVDVNADVNS